MYRVDRNNFYEVQKKATVYPHLALVFGNLQVLCEDCNMGKGAWDSTDFRPDAV